MAIELVAFTDLKDFLGLEEDSLTNYPDLSLIRDGVTDAIEDFLGRDLEKGDKTETYWVGDLPTRIIYLKAIPISSISSVVLTQDGEDTTYTDDDYNITEYGIKLYTKVQNCKITISYNGGLSATTKSLSRAALLQTVYEFQGKEQVGAESVSTEGGFVKRPELGLLREVKRMLQKEMHPLRW